MLIVSCCIGGVVCGVRWRLATVCFWCLLIARRVTAVSPRVWVELTCARFKPFHTSSECEGLCVEKVMPITHAYMHIFGLPSNRTNDFRCTIIRSEYKSCLGLVLCTISQSPFIGYDLCGRLVLIRLGLATMISERTLKKNTYTHKSWFPIAIVCNLGEFTHIHELRRIHKSNKLTSKIHRDTFIWFQYWTMCWVNLLSFF